MASAKDVLRASLLAQSTSSSSGSKEPDGVLTPTPDTAGEYRSSSQCLDCVPTTSTYLEDDDDGRKPNELFGKFTWKIDKFSEIGKRELRSAQFDVGDYKWYILVYPQGCDVCNHLSLFLCVADYDKLLPGWSHFAQFTIAVVNKDAKKSKYSDTLHRFCKKEHDWGWKKFMELSKVMDGFTVADTLVIKAQVQVILDKPGRPFRCLDAQYRRELVRVYLTNVESICRRFCDDKRARLAWLRSEAPAFREWWEGLAAEKRRLLTAERGEVVLKGVVKQFFNEKEVTSTLVMDALYAGCRQLEEASRSWAADPASVPAPNVVVHADRNVFTLGADLLDVAARSACPDWIPPYREDKGALGADGLVLRSGGPESGPEGEARRDSVDRDERRLGELGRRTVEMLAIAHIFTEKLESEYRQYQALKRQDALIAEEEEAGRLEDERQAARQQAEKERRAKKKEKQKKRKEEERLKREAEEEELRRAEEGRRREAEARAEEKRRQEQEEREREAEAAAAAAQRERQRQQQQQQEQQQQQAVAPAAAAAGASGRGSGGELRSHVLASQNGRQSGSVSPDCSSSDVSDSAAPQQTSRKGSPAPAAAAAGEAAPPPAAAAAARDAGGAADQVGSGGRGPAAAGGAPSASATAAAATSAAPAAGPAAAALAAELESHKRRVADLEDQVAILQQHNRMHEASASSSGRQLGDLQRQVADLSRALAERDRAVEAARRRAAALQQQLEARDALIAELRRGGGGAAAAAAAAAAARPGDGGTGARPRSSSGESSEPQEGAEAAGGDAAGSAGAAKGFLNGTGAAWGGAAAAASAAAVAAAAAARAGSGDAEAAPSAGENGGAARPGLRGAAPAAPSGGGGAPAGSAAHSRTPSLSASAGPSPAAGPQPSAQVHPTDLSIGPSALGAAAGGAAAGQPLVRSGSAGAAGFRGPTKGGGGAAGSSTRFAGAAAAAQGAVAQNGIAGVLHSSVPVSGAGAQSQQPTTPSFRNTAGSASGVAASGTSAAARPGSAAAAKGAAAMGGIGLGGKGGAAAAAAFGAFGGGPQAYGGMAAGAGKAGGGALGVGASPGGTVSPAAATAAAAGGQRTAAPAQAMDDGGAEFLHMSMIDSLLQE